MKSRLVSGKDTQNRSRIHIGIMKTKHPDFQSKNGAKWGTTAGQMQLYIRIWAHGGIRW